MSKAFEQIFIIMFENENADKVLENDYFASLADRGLRLTECRGVTHPSQPNYIATIGGDFFDWADDNCKDFDETNLIDLLEQAGVGWKAYMENLPDDKLTCVGPNVAGPPLPGQALYYRKHNPFVSFESNQTPERLQHVLNASEFDPDQLAAFTWYGPNIANCGHTVPGGGGSGGSSINVDFAAKWLEGFLDPLLANSKFMANTLVVLTFDEDWPQVDDGAPETGDPIYTVLLGDMVTPGTEQSGQYTHYNLLATIEKNFELGNLGRNDATATPYEFLWQ